MSWLCCRKSRDVPEARGSGADVTTVVRPVSLDALREDEGCASILVAPEGDLVLIVRECSLVIRFVRHVYFVCRWALA